MHCLNRTFRDNEISSILAGVMGGSLVEYETLGSTFRVKVVVGGSGDEPRSIKANGLYVLTPYGLVKEANETLQAKLVRERDACAALDKEVNRLHKEIGYANIKISELNALLTEAQYSTKRKPLFYVAKRGE